MALTQRAFLYLTFILVLGRAPSSIPINHCVDKIWHSIATINGIFSSLKHGSAAVAILFHLLDTWSASFQIHNTQSAAVIPSTRWQLSLSFIDLPTHGDVAPNPNPIGSSTRVVIRTLVVVTRLVFPESCLELRIATAHFIMPASLGLRLASQ
jgi:hypothetical protein